MHSMGGVLGHSILNVGRFISSVNSSKDSSRVDPGSS